MARSRGWADGRVLAGWSCDATAMVSWRGALAQCSGAKGAMLDVSPLPLVLLELQMDPPAWDPHHQPHERWPSLPCSSWSSPPRPPPLPLWHLQPSLFSATPRWATTHLADLGPLASKHSWHERVSKLSKLWASCWGPCIYRAWYKQP